MSATYSLNSNPPGEQLFASHPMDSSRLLLTLLQLSQNQSTDDGEMMKGVVSVSTLQRLLTVLNYRDTATMQHSRRVALLTSGIAQRLGWHGRALRVIEAAALLHDLGKIGVPNQILQKPGRLSPDEAEFVSQHHEVAFELLQAFRVDGEVVDIIVRSHFPEKEIGASGTVTQGTRILAVADAYDSLTHSQVFREAFSHEECIKLMTNEQGGRFDRVMVQSLARWLETDGKELYADAGLRADLMEPPPVDLEVLAQVNQLCHLLSYLHLLETIYDAFYIVDADMKFAVWSRGAERLFGMPRADLMNQTWSRRLLRFGDEFGRPVLAENCPLHKVTQDRHPQCSTLRHVQANGETVELEVQTWPLLDEHGQLHGVAEIFRNISQSKRNPGRFQELQRAASHDALTGVVNRGELERQLDSFLEGYLKSPETSLFSVIFLDIDHFKNINDKYLHTTGDKVLIALTRLLQDELYSGEVVGRFGGEEFVIICPETGLKQAIEKSERLRRAIQNAQFVPEHNLRVTASFGVAQSEPDDTLAHIVSRADEALFDSKRGGRNRTSWRTKQADNESHAEALDPFMSVVTFETQVTSGIITQKIGGYINENNALLLTVTPEKLELQVGQLGLFSRWGKEPNKQPLKITMELCKSRRTNGRGGQEISLRAIPLGKPKSSEQFQERAGQVLRLIKSYFAAH